MNNRTRFIIIRKPFVEEAEAISALMAINAEKGLVLPRSVDDIRNAIDIFLAAELDGRIVGAVSRYDYGQHLMEIRSLVVADDVGKLGIGTMLLKVLIRNLHHEGANRIFALSYSPYFFRRNGFIEVPRESLPEKIWKDCQFCKDRDNCGETALLYAPEQPVENA